MGHKSFTELDVYKECRKFRKEISVIVKQHFPKHEKYLISAQILDSARFVTANIAEGHGRFYYQDNIKFCRNARGSLEETLEHLITAYDDWTRSPIKSRFSKTFPFYKKTLKTYKRIYPIFKKFKKRKS